MLKIKKITPPSPAAAPPTPQTASPIKPTTDPCSPLPDLPPHGSFEVDPHHLEAQSVEDPQVHSHVPGPCKIELERPSERAPPPLPTPATLLVLASTPKPSVIPSSVSLLAQRPLELTSEEEEEGELVHWDDDDDLEAASPTTPDALGKETLAGLGAGCAAPPPPGHPRLQDPVDPPRRPRRNPRSHHLLWCLPPLRLEISWRCPA